MRVAVAALLVALVGQVYAECENGLDVTGCYKGKWSYESTPITTTCTEEMSTDEPWCMLPAYQVSWGGASPMQCFLLGAPAGPAASGLTCLSALCDAEQLGLLRGHQLDLHRRIKWQQRIQVHGELELLQLRRKPDQGQHLQDHAGGQRRQGKRRETMVSGHACPLQKQPATCMAQPEKQPAAADHFSGQPASTTRPPPALLARRASAGRADIGTAASVPV